MKRTQAPQRLDSMNVRVLPVVYTEIFAALGALKGTHKGWSIQRIVNLALVRFLRDLKTLDADAKERLYQDYTLYIGGE